MAKYTLDPAAFQENLLNADWMVDEMERRAERAKAFAESIAPIDTDSGHPGRYKAAFSVDPHRHGGIHGDRAEATLRNDAVTDDGASLAVFVEFGTEHNSAHHVLSRAQDLMT